MSSRLVYVIGVESSPVKIGVAEKIRSRLYQLQIGCPDQLRVHHLVRVPFDLGEPIEAKAHAELADRHRRGEWFDVHKTEAAALLDRLKAEMLPEYQWKLRGPDADLLTRLKSAYNLHNGARDAVWDYWDRMEAADNYIAHANGFILKHAGMAAYAAFSVSVAQRKTFSGLSARERTKAEGALVLALNQLCRFRSRYVTEFGAALYRRECEAMSDPRAALRPSSLPPVRAA